jgi:hypothetical protein
VNRRTFGRGRTIVAAGSVLVLIGCFLPWSTTGTTESGLTPIVTTAFAGAGIVVFVAAIALLALIALPYAAGDQPMPLDRPTFFGVVVAAGALGLLLRAFQLAGLGALGLPDRALGLWLAAVGLAISAWGVAELVAEPPRG